MKPRQHENELGFAPLATGCTRLFTLISFVTVKPQTSSLSSPPCRVRTVRGGGGRGGRKQFGYAEKWLLAAGGVAGERRGKCLFIRGRQTVLIWCRFKDKKKKIGCSFYSINICQFSRNQITANNLRLIRKCHQNEE